MTALYAESSAVLEWLLGTERGVSVRTALAATPGVIASELTTAEVARTLRRLTATGQLTPEQRTESYGLYLAAAAHWTFWAVDNGILSRPVKHLEWNLCGRSMPFISQRRPPSPPRLRRLSSAPEISVFGSTPGL